MRTATTRNNVGFINQLCLCIIDQRCMSLVLRVRYTNPSENTDISVFVDKTEISVEDTIAGADAKYHIAHMHHNYCTVQSTQVGFRHYTIFVTSCNNNKPVMLQLRSSWNLVVVCIRTQACCIHCDRHALATEHKKKRPRQVHERRGQ